MLTEKNIAAFRKWDDNTLKNLAPIEFDHIINNILKMMRIFRK